MKIWNTPIVEEMELSQTMGSAHGSVIPDENWSDDMPSDFIYTASGK